MNLKFNFIKDCVKLFLFNEKSFKNIQKENILTPILWLAIPLIIIITLISTFAVGLYSEIGTSAGIIDYVSGFFIGILISVIFGLLAAAYMIIFYGITHLILVGFGSKVKFVDNFKLQLSTYSFGLTIWMLPIILIGILIFSIFPFEDFMVLSGGLMVLLILALFGIYIWYFVVLIKYLAKQNKVSQLKTFFAVIVVSIISIVISLVAELAGL